MIIAISRRVSGYGDISGVWRVSSLCSPSLYGPLGAGVTLFLSQFTNRLDAKGRVSIPAPFRAVLEQDGFEGLLVQHTLDIPALDCGGKALLNDVTGFLDRLEPYSELHELFSTALLGSSEVLRIDGEGRIVLSELCRAYANIGSEVTFVGQGRKFQIWEPHRFKAFFEEAKSRLRDMRKQGGPVVKGGAPRLEARE